MVVHDDKTNTIIIAKLLDEDRRMMVREMEVESEIPKTSMHCISTDILQKHKILVRCVPYFLSAEQKAERMHILQELLTHYINECESFLQWIITMNEICVLDFEL